MLVFSQDEMMELVSYGDMLETIEQAYDIYERDAYVMPDRIHIEQEEDTLLYMPCFLDRVFGTKILTLFPKNQEKGVPTLDGIMLLNDRETGRPLCVMDGKTITALRTGAVGGVAIRYTTPETVESLGLIGAGAQSFYLALYACMVRQFKRVYLYDSQVGGLEAFVRRLRPVIPAETELIVCPSSRALLDQAQVIITATPATAPVLPNDAGALEGKHFIGIGSYKPHMREFPDALYPLLDQVYIDGDVALEESGDLIQPIQAGLLREEQMLRFSRLLRDKGAVEKAKGKTTLFKSVGSGIFDVMTANLLYEKAKEKGLAL